MTEHNFCERCGKRLVDGSIHTCTPPVEEALNRKADNARELGLDYEAGYQDGKKAAHGIKEKA